MDYIVDQLNDIYYTEEWWHKTRMTVDGATKYHRTMLERGCLMPEVMDGWVVGYVEAWRLNEAQVERLYRCQPFCALEENTTGGDIAWVANLWVAFDARHGFVLKNLNRRFRRFAEGCEWVGGIYNKKPRAFRFYRMSKQAIGV